MTDTITLPRSVVEQALEDLEMTINYVQSPIRREDMRDSIEALQEVLDQEKSPQHASSALRASCEVPQVTDQMSTSMSCKDVEVYCTKHPQVKQEPVAWQYDFEIDGEVTHDWLTTDYDEAHNPKAVHYNIRPLYAHPQNLNCKSTQARLATLWGYVKPQPKREPLTDKVIQELADEGVFHANIFEIVRRIEEEHGIFKLRAHGIGGEA